MPGDIALLKLSQAFLWFHTYDPVITPALTRDPHAPPRPPLMSSLRPIGCWALLSFFLVQSNSTHPSRGSPSPTFTAKLPWCL